ncbi:hypothetical protein HanXRQr2_Chr03g0133131 [Helianthus annuus]|uniref:Uncharacterized protein n=1 Tax=Helianthus annuus TaxID=4232 RepID=A0A9K3JL09_HELAN|nr:hypothetical protein HanXRQr2_Chr03g0133131 [Helianthus annuus]KAJ0945592.1 hypothetical protein HanPSC8_Chr03g0129891 [Helianthus annuus]
MEHIGILCCQRRKAHARCIGLARSLSARCKKSVGLFFKKSAHREKNMLCFENK